MKPEEEKTPDYASDEFLTDSLLNSLGDSLKVYRDTIKQLGNRIKELESKLAANWINASKKKPEFNVAVLVFIPEEDNHITTGMWDVSRKWVLFDEYRVPVSQVTYWHPMIAEPNDKNYIRSSKRVDEEEKITYKMRALQKTVYDLEKGNKALKEKLEAQDKEYKDLLLRSV